MPNPFRNPARGHVPPYKAPTPGRAPEPQAPEPEDLGPRSNDLGELVSGTRGAVEKEPFSREDLNAFLGAMVDAQHKITYQDLFKAVYPLDRTTMGQVNAVTAGVDVLKNEIEPELWLAVCHTDRTYDESLGISDEIEATTRGWTVLPEEGTHPTISGLNVAGAFREEHLQMQGIGTDEVPQIDGIIKELGEEYSSGDAEEPNVEDELTQALGPDSLVGPSCPTCGRTNFFNERMLRDHMSKCSGPAAAGEEEAEAGVEDPNQTKFNWPDSEWDQFMGDFRAGSHSKLPDEFGPSKPRARPDPRAAAPRPDPEEYADLDMAKYIVDPSLAEPDELNPFEQGREAADELVGAIVKWWRLRQSQPEELMGKESTARAIGPAQANIKRALEALKEIVLDSAEIDPETKGLRVKQGVQAGLLKPRKEMPPEIIWQFISGNYGEFLDQPSTGQLRPDHSKPNIRDANNINY